MTAHQYGWRRDHQNVLLVGACVRGSGDGVSHGGATSHVCHGEFHCLGCLQAHVREIQESGGTATYVGELKEGP